MARHVVIGTAGHVDHGKTALVKALTGTDTDRWAEEKQRGITIDIGFAQLDLSDGVHASVVDVPGHEDFVRNMVAGATGVDLTLLVVAADEGVMPQTVEHLAILDFLGVRSGVAAISKVDLVEPDWLDLVIDDVSQRLRKTPMEWDGPLPVSGETGEGLDALRAALGRGAERVLERTADDLFRMPIDRVFSVAGAGTVVTGTTWAGSIRVGEEVRVLPVDRAARVRSIQAHGESADSAIPGRRTAVSLVGIDRHEAERGSTVVSDAAWKATRTVDVLVTLLPEARPVTQRTRLRLHLGTTEVIARVTPADREISPGGEGVARLRLEGDLVCRWGDRGVLRSYSPVTTIGGCVVIDVRPPGRPRRPSADAGRYSGDPVTRVRAFVRGEGKQGLALSDLPVRVGVLNREIEQVLEELAGAGGEGGSWQPAAGSRGGERGGVVRVGDWLMPARVVREASQRVFDALSSYHSEYPLRVGMSLEAARKVIGGVHLAEYVLQGLEESGKVVNELGALRRAEFEPTLAGSHAEYGVVVTEALVEAGSQGMTLADLKDRVPAPGVEELVEYLVMRGTVVKVGGSRYYDRDVLQQLVRRVVGEIRQRGEASPAELREVLGLTRKYLIPLLEWLDAKGFTARAGNVRRLGPEAHLVE
jgi:selenocysteine-specific elongation factor